jgi:hypothetical protein
MARPEEGRPEQEMPTELYSAGYEVASEGYWNSQYQADFRASLSRTYGGRIYRNLPSPQSLRDGSDAQPDL